MKLELNFDEKDIEQLYETKCESFLASQMGRFKVWPTYDGVSLKTAIFYGKDSEMMFTDNFLNAKLIFEFYSHEQSHDAAMILLDEVDGNWCVVRRVNQL